MGGMDQIDRETLESVPNDPRGPPLPRFMLDDDRDGARGVARLWRGNGKQPPNRGSGPTPRPLTPGVVAVIISSLGLVGSLLFAVGILFGLNLQVDSPPSRDEAARKTPPRIIQSTPPFSAVYEPQERIPLKARAFTPPPPAPSSSGTEESAAQPEGAILPTLSDLKASETPPPPAPIMVEAPPAPAPESVPSVAVTPEVAAPAAAASPDPAPAPPPVPDPAPTPVQAPAQAPVPAPVQAASPVEVPARPAISRPAPARIGRFTVQAGAFQSEENARSMRDRLQSSGLKASISPRTDRRGGTLYRVQVGRYATRGKAGSTLAAIVDMGIDAVVVGAD